MDEQSQGEVVRTGCSARFPFGVRKLQYILCISVHPADLNGDEDVSSNFCSADLFRARTHNRQHDILHCVS